MEFFVVLVLRLLYLYEYDNIGLWKGLGGFLACSGSRGKTAWGCAAVEHIDATGIDHDNGPVCCVPEFQQSTMVAAGGRQLGDCYDIRRYLDDYTGLKALKAEHDRYHELLAEDNKAAVDYIAGIHANHEGLVYAGQVHCVSQEHLAAV